MAQNQKRKKVQPLSLKQEHDTQYNLVHKRLSNLAETAPSETTKNMLTTVLRAWEEAVSEESKTGEAFALYGFPSKTEYRLVPENRIYEGRNPVLAEGEVREQLGNVYIIEVDQNPFEVALEDEEFSSPSTPLDMALQQAFAVTYQRFFTADGDMKQPNNPECRRIAQGLLSATRARYIKEEMEEE